MFRYLIIEVLFPLLIFLFLRSFVRSFFSNRRDVARRDKDSYPDEMMPGVQGPPASMAGGELQKDPVCGTYVSTGASVTRKVDGRMLHFCSKECRDKYRAA
jgi:YHS domain-containing protein